MRAYERFLQYVRIHTTSSETSGTHPSFAGERVLAEKLAEELSELALTDVLVDEKCYVYGFLPATEGLSELPGLGLLSHMDTSEEASGENVKPVIWENYDGESLTLPGNSLVLSTDRFPEMRLLRGETLITTDGTTLLGADDKAGIAEILTALEIVQKEKIPHGPLYICFTPDEEIGEGADYVDYSHFHPAFAYTVDGGDVNCLEYENFNAASAKVRIRGLSVHPGDAKDRMINAQNVAMEFHSLLPEAERPEHTEGCEGFFHLTEMSGRVSEAELSYIVRDHDRERFEQRKKMLEDAAAELNRRYGEGTVTLTVKDSYYNMLEKIRPHMHLIRTAEQAISENGMVPAAVPIRGGTDGARLSYEGIPCPNLGTGGFHFHGVFECITEERMDRAANVLVSIIRRYGEPV